MLHTTGNKWSTPNFMEGVLLTVSRPLHMCPGGRALTPHHVQAVMPAYARMHTAMAPSGITTIDPGGGPAPAARQRVHWTQDETCTLLGYASAEYELYTVFDPLVERATAVAMCQRLVAWLKTQHAQLFIPL